MEYDREKEVRATPEDLSDTRRRLTRSLQKGGDPAAGSPTATLLRLRPSHEQHRGNRPPEG